MKNALRWIAVLPGAVIGGLFISFITKYITQFWQDDWGWAWLHSVYFYFTYGLMSLIMPVAYTIIGMRIAPSYRRETGIFLISIMIIYTVILVALTFFVTTGDYNYKLEGKSIVYFVFQFLGCLISFMFLPKNDQEFMEQWETK